MDALPVAVRPVDTPTSPRCALPTNACDAHIHMVADDYPLWSKRVEDPSPGTLVDWVERLEHHLKTLAFSRVVIVHSILYGGDNAVTIDGVAKIGLERARGIGLVTDSATDAELDALASGGISGIRLNYVHGGILSWAGVRNMAPRLAERGMHVQMLMNADKHLAEIADDVAKLEVPVVFDHIGWPDIDAGTDEPGFERLRRLVADGDVYVKLSGIYRVSDAPYDAAAAHVSALAAANPDRCLWGSDWPHLMLGDARQPDAGVLLNAFLDTVTASDQRERILSTAPGLLYGFDT
ncbi:MAG: amidohydrolase family protein [Pseudomonadota bacterium]